MALAREEDRRDRVPGAGGVDADLSIRGLEESIANEKFRTWEMPVSQMSGIHLNAPQLAWATRLRCRFAPVPETAWLHSTSTLLRRCVPKCWRRDSLWPASMRWRPLPRQRRNSRSQALRRPWS